MNYSRLVRRIHETEKTITFASRRQIRLPKTIYLTLKRLEQHLDHYEPIYVTNN